MVGRPPPPPPPPLSFPPPPSSYSRRRLCRAPPLPAQPPAPTLMVGVPPLQGANAGATASAWRALVVAASFGLTPSFSSWAPATNPRGPPPSLIGTRLVLPRGSALPVRGLPPPPGTTPSIRLLSPLICLHRARERQGTWGAGAPVCAGGAGDVDNTFPAAAATLGAGAAIALQGASFPPSPDSGCPPWTRPFSPPPSSGDSHHLLPPSLLRIAPSLRPAPRPSLLRSTCAWRLSPGSTSAPQLMLLLAGSLRLSASSTPPRWSTSPPPPTRRHSPLRVPEPRFARPTL
jgi:hypothetical protein